MDDEVASQRPLLRRLDEALPGDPHTDRQPPTLTTPHPRKWQDNGTNLKGQLTDHADMTQGSQWKKRLLVKTGLKEPVFFHGTAGHEEEVMSIQIERLR